MNELSNAEVGDYNGALRVSNLGVGWATYCRTRATSARGVDVWALGLDRNTLTARSVMKEFLVRVEAGQRTDSERRAGGACRSTKGVKKRHATRGPFLETVIKIFLG